MTKKLLLVFIALSMLVSYTSCGEMTPSIISSTSSSTSEPTRSSGNEQEYTIPSYSFNDEKNWEAPLPYGLMQGWCGSYGLGALMPARYFFNPDGTFYYTENEYAGDIRDRYLDGSWTYLNGKLLLEVQRKITIEGGESRKNEAGSGRSYITWGTLVRVDFSSDEFVQLEMTLDVFRENPLEGTEEESLINGAIQLNNVIFYAAPGIGYRDMPTYWETYVYS